MLTPVVLRIALAVVALCSMLGTVAGAELRVVPGGAVPRVIHAPGHLSDEILVRFKDKASPPDMASAHAWGGGRLFKAFRSVTKLNLVKLPPGLSAKEAIKRYRQHPDVLYAEPNYVVTTLATPNDERFAELWGLHNTGVGGVADADLDAVEAWDLTTGSGAPVVVVIDSGIDYTHEDLAANMFRNTEDCNDNGIDDDGNGYVDDCHGINAIANDGDPMDDNAHGTHVAGTIGAVGNNGIGVVGVNWNVQLMACKFLGASGSGFTSDAIQCLDYVSRMKDRGVNIVATNNSWGGGAFSQALFDAIEAHRQRGILFVAAAGNDGTDNDVAPQFPSSYALPNVLAVAATTRSDTRASFSNVGRRTVHLGAPGSEIVSTTPGDGYESLSGTSMATPHVTGVAALLKAHDPSRDWRAIKNLILAGGDANATLNNTLTGRRLNASGALSCTNSTVLTRLRPIVSTVIGTVGTPVDLAALHINCAAPNGPVTVTVEPGGQNVVLQDDGAVPDQFAGDGVYSGRWTPEAPGTYALTFPDGEIVTVAVLREYAAVPTPFEYRAITGSSLNLADDSTAQITSPFPIGFGGGSFTSLFVSSNGTVNFTEPFVGFENAAIPSSHVPTLVAPFWDDLFALHGASQNVFWQVIGTAPDRELVIEWRSLRHFTCRDDPSATITFQVVFFEGRSPVLFNYADTTVGGACATANRGGSATVGVQVAPDRGTQLSFNSGSVDSGMGLLWTLADAAIDVGPSSHAYGDVAVGSSADRVFTVQNTGAGTVTGTVTAAPPFSIVTGGSFSLLPAQTHAVIVRFSPTTGGSVAGSVEFTSNVEPVSRAVTGTGVSATVTIKASDATATENGSNKGVFRVTRTGSTASPLTVLYSLGGTATNGSDYVSLSGSAVLAAGATTVDIVVTPINDTEMEGGETVIATLTPGPGYDIGAPSSATVTIASDERVTLTAVTKTATEAGSTPGVFRVARTGSTTSPLTVFYSINGTATAGSDYTALSGSVTIPIGAATADILVSPIDDGVVESNETVIATLTPHATYVVGTPKTATVTIVNNTAVVTIAALDASAAEAGLNTGAFRITRTGSTTSALTVYYRVGGTAQAGTDYATLARVVTIPAGASSADIVVTPINDTKAEGGETVKVTLTSKSAYVIGTPSNATVTIVSNE